MTDDVPPGTSAVATTAVDDRRAVTCRRLRRRVHLDSPRRHGTVEQRPTPSRVIGEGHETPMV